ncbi:MAG: helix-turn-helix domain-containing protein [Actinomycetota bacterium]
MLTTGRVAASLGVTINTVKNWAKVGKIRSVRLPSGHYRIPASELDRLLHDVRSKGLKEYEQWQRKQPMLPLDLEEVLAWNEQALEIARSQGPLSEDSIEEKGERVRRMHQILASLNR